MFARARPAAGTQVRAVATAWALQGRTGHGFIQQRLNAPASDRVARSAVPSARLMERVETFPGSRTSSCQSCTRDRHPCDRQAWRLSPRHTGRSIRDRGRGATTDRWDRRSPPTVHAGVVAGMRCRTAHGSHTTGMKSKVHPKYKTRYRVANGPAYNQALVRRGDVTLWLAPEAIAAWTPRRSGIRGGQRRYSNLAIATALTLRLIYHLPLRQAEGFLHSLFAIMELDLPAPNCTTLSRRGQHLTRHRRPVPTGEGHPSGPRQHGAFHRRGRRVGRSETRGTRQAWLEEAASGCRLVGGDRGPGPDRRACR